MEMKRTIRNMGLTGLAAIAFSGCGLVEKYYEEVNYETLTNAKGRIELYSGGKLVKEFKDSKIIYSNSDSEALYFKDSAGKTHYWQGEAYIELE